MAVGEHHDVGSAAGAGVDLAGDIGQVETGGELAGAEVDQHVASRLGLAGVLEAQQEAIPETDLVHPYTHGG